MSKFIPTTAGTFAYADKKGTGKLIAVTIVSGDNGLTFKAKNGRVYSVDASRDWVAPVVAPAPVVSASSVVTTSASVTTRRGRKPAEGIREYTAPSVLRHFKIDTAKYRVMILPREKADDPALTLLDGKSFRIFCRAKADEVAVLMPR